MTPLRLILVGLGARAQIWLRVTRANPAVEIVAMCDPDQRARDGAALLLPGVPVGAALGDVIGAGADAALLATPPAGREALIRECCDAGVAILAEKPLADDIASAARMVALAEAAGVLLIVGLNFRYLPVTQAMKQLLEEGAIGHPGFGRFTYERWRDGRQAHLNAYPLTMAHPMLWEQSIHHFDLMRYVYGAEPLHVQAHTWNPPWTMYAGDTNVSALIAFEGGMTVNYQGTWQSGRASLGFNWRTDGPDGIVEQRSMFGDLVWAQRMAPDLTPIPLPAYEPWVTDAAALLDRFAAMVRGEIAPECTGRDHLRSLHMLAACILAASRKSRADIEEVRAGIAERVPS